MDINYNSHQVPQPAFAISPVGRRRWEWEDNSRCCFRLLLLLLLLLTANCLALALLPRVEVPAASALARSRQQVIMLPHVVPLTNVVGVLPNGARNCWLRFSRTEGRAHNPELHCIGVDFPRALCSRVVWVAKRHAEVTLSSSGRAFIRLLSLALPRRVVLHVPYIHVVPIWLSAPNQVSSSDCREVCSLCLSGWLRLAAHETWLAGWPAC